MNIYQATIDDLEELTELFDGYRVFYEKESDKEGAYSFLKERIEKNESVIFITRNSYGKATGFTQLYPLFSSTRMKRGWLLNDLFVDPKYRAMGYSISLIERAKRHCKETGSVGMTLETAKDNYVGNRLYPKTGWTLDKEHNFYYWEVE